MGGLRRLAADTDLENGSKVWRNLEEGDRGGRGLKMGQVAIDKEEDILYWYLLGNQSEENRNEGKRSHEREKYQKRGTRGERLRWK